MSNPLDDFNREVSEFIAERVIMLRNYAERIADVSRSLKMLAICARDTILEARRNGCSQDNIDPCVDALISKFMYCYKDARRDLEVLLDIKRGQEKWYLDYYYGGPQSSVNIGLYLTAAMNDLNTAMTLADYMISLGLAYIGAATEYDRYIITFNMDHVLDILNKYNISVPSKEQLRRITGRENKILYLAEHLFRRGVFDSILKIIADNASNAADTISLLAVQLREKADSIAGQQKS